MNLDFIYTTQFISNESLQPINGGFGLNKSYQLSRANVFAVTGVVKRGETIVQIFGFLEDGSISNNVEIRPEYSYIRDGYLDHKTGNFSVEWTNEDSSGCELFVSFEYFV